MSEDPKSYASVIDMLTHDCHKYAKENARLKAEVERLTNENDNNSVMKEEWYLKCMSARAEVERLRKAGDALAEVLNDEGYNTDMEEVEAWNAAKEGKPSV